MFNRFRKPGVTEFDTIMLNWNEHLARMKSTVKYAPIYLAFVLTVLMIFVGLLLLLSSESNYKSSMKVTSTADEVTYPVEIDGFGDQASDITQKSALDNDDDREEASSSNAYSRPIVRFDLAIFVLCLLEAILITVLGMFFSGVFAGVFLNPINPIKFAPFAVIHDGMLSFRFWICCSNNRFLHDVKINIGYAYDDKCKHSELLFMDHKGSGNDFARIQQEEYLELRGVQHIGIPLCSSTGIELLDALDKNSDSNPVIKVSMSAKTETGESLSREVEYSGLRLIKDAAFAPLHFREDLFENAANKTPRKLQNLEAFANFCKIVPVEATDDLDLSIYSSNGINPQVTKEDVLGQEKKWERQIDRAKEQVKSLRDGQRILQSNEELKTRFTIGPITSWNPYMSYSDWKLINKLDDCI